MYMNCHRLCHFIIQSPKIAPTGIESAREKHVFLNSFHPEIK